MIDISFFLRNALAASLLTSIVCGIIGVYVVVNRMVSISGGISHAAFGGIGLAFFLDIDPIQGAGVFALASAFGIGAISRKTNLPEDTSIGILWASGMALGALFIHLTPGYVPDISTYLFGEILLVSSGDLALMFVISVIVLSATVFFYRGFFTLSFDEEFGRTRGLSTNALYFSLLCLIALSVIAMIRSVGIILVIALLSMPAAITRQYTYDMRTMMIFAVLLCLLFNVSGLWLSHELGVPSGATIALVASAGFVLSILLKRGAILYERWGSDDV